jgi:hypothetical protein
MLGLAYVDLDTMRLGASCLLDQELVIVRGREGRNQIILREWGRCGILTGLADSSLNTRSCMDVTPRRQRQLKITIADWV